MSSTHRTDASALLDNRGYSGVLIRGQNPALLFEKAVRDRITDSYYWKEQCFALNAATLCDRAAELDCVGGTYGDNGRPTPFLCLAFKMLQLVPERGIVLEYLNFAVDEEDEDEDMDEGEGVNGDGRGMGGRKRGYFKYLRALAAFYIRLAWEPVDIYTTLSPLLADSRKLKRRTRHGYALTYVDQFIDDLLSKERICATSLWKLTPRTQLEDLDLLEPYVSPIQDEVDALDEDEEPGSDGEVQENGRSRSRSPQD